MILFIKIIIIFHIFIPSSSASLDKFLNQNRFDTITKLVAKVLITCVHQTNDTFVTLLTDSKGRVNLPVQFYNTFCVLKTKSFISNDNVTTVLSNIFDSPYKAEIVLTIVSSTSTLQQFLTKLKKTRVWNIYATYIIIDAETLERNCERANDFLRTIWKNDILVSTFFCMNTKGEILMYNYNPFLNLAPKEWKEVPEESNNGSSNDSWTLYKRNLIEDQTTCVDLDFPKDLTIGGHEIKAMAMPVPPTLVIHSNRTGWAKYEGLDAQVARVLESRMNASIDIKIADDGVQNYGNSSANKILHHSPVDIIKSRKRDFLMNAQYIFNKPPNTSFTYPHRNAGVSVMTRYAGYETGPSKILRFMNPKLIFGICIVFLITVPIVAILGGESMISASLEVLRIMIGVSVVRMPKRTPLRLYLITVILLFLITGSTFQGSLSSLLTSPVRLPNIDDIVDLRKSADTIYIFYGYKDGIIDKDLEPRTKFTNHWNCSKYVIEQEHSVCVAERARLAKISFELKLYVSKHRLTTLYSAFIVRPDWPLIRRVSKLLQSMSQCGLMEHWFSRSVWAYRPQWLRKPHIIEYTNYRPMIVSDLDFAFYILLFGLTASILVFMIEQLTWKKCHGGPKKRKADLPPLFEYTE